MTIQDKQLKIIHTVYHDINTGVNKEWYKIDGQDEVYDKCEIEDIVINIPFTEDDYKQVKSNIPRNSKGVSL